MIVAQCQCGKELKADDKYAGKTATCPRCRRPVLLPELETVPATAQPAFPTFTNDESETDVEFPALPSLPRRSAAAAPTAESPVEHERSAADLPPPGSFRKHFFATWWCSWVLRVLGLLGIVWSVVLLIIMGVSMMAAMSEPTPKPRPARNAGGFAEPDFSRFAPSPWAVAATGTPLVLGAFTIGCIFLAASELLTALAWSYLKSGIRGRGLLEDGN